MSIFSAQLFSVASIILESMLCIKVCTIKFFPWDIFLTFFSNSLKILLLNISKKILHFFYQNIFLLKFSFQDFFVAQTFSIPQA